MAKWQYFIETGKVGGTANKQTDKTFYVDSYKGLDSNVGSYLAPYKSIQKVLDECASTGNGGAITAVDIIATGYFEEGDFLNRRTKVALIAEGRVFIKAILQIAFRLDAGSTVGYTSFNFDINSGKKKRNFGRITLKDFIGDVKFGVMGFGFEFLEKHGCYNVTFDNCSKVNHNNGANTGQVGLIEGCVFNVPSTFTVDLGASFYQPIAFIQKNSFIGDTIVNFLPNNLTVRDNYFAPNALFRNPSNIYNENSFIVRNNHIEGDTAGKIVFGVNVFTNRESARGTFGTFDNGGKLSTDLPQFNTVLNSLDLTYVANAPNATGGHDGKQIGAFGLALGAQSTENVNWDATGVDNTTLNGSAELTASPTGTMETTAGILVVANAAEPRRLLRLTLPDALIDYTGGATINTLRSADQATPAIETVEIQYSTDNVSYSGWIKVPIEGVPKVDAVGVGNGDDDFDGATGAFIVLTHIKYRVTLRDNEVNLP